MTEKNNQNKHIKNELKYQNNKYPTYHEETASNASVVKPCEECHSKVPEKALTYY